MSAELNRDESAVILDEAAVEEQAALIPSDPKAALAHLVAEWELPVESTPADVIQHVIDKSGHTVTLLYLIQLAYMLDADLQIHIGENEAVEPTPV